MHRDQIIFDLITEEKERQTNGLELIASENYVSEQVMEAAGLYLLINMPKDILEKDITEDVKL